jgi:hypothetical protein
MAAGSLKFSSKDGEYLETRITAEKLGKLVKSVGREIHKFPKEEAALPLLHDTFLSEGAVNVIYVDRGAKE